MRLRRPRLRQRCWTAARRGCASRSSAAPRSYQRRAGAQKACPDASPRAGADCPAMLSVAGRWRARRPHRGPVRRRRRRGVTEELVKEWKVVAGMVVGGAEFKERMLALVEGPLRQGRSASYSGEAKRAHGEAEAERLLARGLAALDWEANQLAETRKGAWEKEMLAWWLCQHTTARRRWVSERLGMGDESRVTQAIGRVKRGGPRELERLKSRLEQFYERNNEEVEA